MSDVPNRQSHQIRWAVIVTMGRVVVEAGTADAAREKAERKGYIVLAALLLEGYFGFTHMGDIGPSCYIILYLRSAARLSQRRDTI